MRANHRPRAREDRTEPATRTRLADTSTYWVQVGAFESAGTASRLAAKLRAQRFAARVVPAGSEGRDRGRWSRVQVGPFPDRERAGPAVRALEQQGFRPFVAIEPD
jgi:cell division septation protein DedD